MPPLGDGHGLDEGVRREQGSRSPVHGGPPARVVDVPDDHEGGPGGFHVHPGRLRPEGPVGRPSRSRSRGGDPRVVLQDRPGGGIEPRVQGRVECGAGIRCHRPIRDHRCPRRWLRKRVRGPRPFHGRLPGPRRRRPAGPGRRGVDVEESLHRRRELHEHRGVVVDRNGVGGPDERPVPEELDRVVALSLLQAEQDRPPVPHQPRVRWVLTKEHAAWLPGQCGLDARVTDRAELPEGPGDGPRPDVGRRVHVGLQQVGERTGRGSRRGELGPPGLRFASLPQQAPGDELHG